MGVPGLWDIVYQQGQSRSLVNLTMREGFEGNTSRRRAYRIGVDASLWYAHASFAKGGENSDLRLLFYRCLQLARLAIIPYFVFDGRERPPIKRGSKKGKAGSHTLTPGFKKIIKCFGWIWREARGEAEAELAHLNREGIIDAVLTDDGDALIFGAMTVIRNQSTKLTGNKSKPALDTNGKASKEHVMIYTADALAQHGLDRAGLILIAMLCGGDYVTDGVKGFGKAVATGLAHAGFGERLLAIYALRDDSGYSARITQWRLDVEKELSSNSKGLLNHKYPSLTLPASFPNLTVLEYYVEPVTSRGQPAPQIRDADGLCLPRLAAFCEKHFGEWGYEETIIKRFRTLVWESALIQLLRRAALQADEQERERRSHRGDYSLDIHTVLHPAPADAHGLPESFITRYVGQPEETGISDAFVNRPARAVASRSIENKNVLQMKIVGNTRKHTSTDGLLEYRVEFTPTLLVELTRLGISGTRGKAPPPSSQAETDPWDVDFGNESSRSKATKAPSKPPPHPDSPQRVWVCAAMLEQVFPDLLEEALAARAGKKKAPKASQRNRQAGGGDLSDGSSEVETERTQSSPPPHRPLPRSTQPLRHTASQPIPCPSRPPTRRVTSPTRSPLLPTQPRARSTSSMPSKLGFRFSFPCPDDPDMMLVEDGLDMPLASSSSTRPTRTESASTAAGPSVYRPVSHAPRRASPPRPLPHSRHGPPQATRAPAASGSGSFRRATSDADRGFDLAGMFGGGDTDNEAEEEPDIIRRANAATNSAMDGIFDAVFKPRGKGKGKVKAKPKTKRAVPAPTPSGSQPRPTKRRKTTQQSQDLPPLSPPRPHRTSPAPTPAASRAPALSRHSSEAGRSQASRASSEVIEIDSDSDDDIPTLNRMRLSSQSTRYLSDDDIIDLS